jgi:MFS family permease
MASSPSLLIAFRTLQGLSAGFFSVSARALMSDLGGPRLRGTTQAIYSSSVSLGFVLGPSLGSLLAVHFDMTTPFWVSAGLSGAAFITLSTISYPSRQRQGTHSALSKKHRIKGLIRDRRFSSLALTHLTFMAGLSVIMTLFPVAGEAEIPGGLAFVGPAFTAAGISGFVFGPFVGRLSDRVGRAPFMLLGAVLTAAEGTALLLTRSPWVIGLGFFLGGIGVAAFINSLHATLGDLTGRKERGTVTGLIGLAGECGGIIGSLLASLVWAQTNLKTPFCLQIAFTACAVFLITWLWRQKSLKPTRRAIVRESILPG